jgi:hypothetical protein
MTNYDIKIKRSYDLMQKIYGKKDSKDKTVYVLDIDGYECKFYYKKDDFIESQFILNPSFFYTVDEKETDDPYYMRKRDWEMTNSKFINLKNKVFEYIQKYEREKLLTNKGKELGDLYDNL